jgi:DNA-binding CsgD family transcriptional regulator
VKALSELGVWQKVDSNLRAGQMSLRSGQYSQARRYIEAGLKQAEQNSLIEAEAAPQTIQLKLAMVWIDYMVGNMEQARGRLQSLHEQSRSLHLAERNAIWITLIQFNTATNNEVVVHYIKEALIVYDWRLNEEPSKLSILKEVLHTRLFLLRYRNKVEQQRNNRDEKYEALCGLMVHLFFPLLIHNAEALIQLCARFIRYGLRKGMNESLALLIGSYEQIVHRTLPSYEPIIPFAVLSSFQRCDGISHSFSYQMEFIGALSHQLSHPLEASVYLVKTIKKAMELQEFDFSNMALITFLVSYSGDVPALLRILDFYDQHLSDRTSDKVIVLVDVAKRYVRAMQDGDELRLFIAVPQSKEFHSTLEDEDNYSCGCKLEAAYLSGYYREALYWAQRGRECEFQMDWTRIRKQRFYEMLALAALYPEQSEVEQKRICKQLRIHLDKMKSWKGFLGYNSAAYLLLAAELKRLTKKPANALGEYLLAIKAARDEKSGLIEGIACERLALCYQHDLASRSGAMVAMLDACAAYSEWGATLKATQIRMLHTDLLRPMSRLYGTAVLEGKPINDERRGDSPEVAEQEMAANEAEAMRTTAREAAGTASAMEPQKLLDSLTGRELEILMALAEGLSNREIAERFCIAETTVKTHTTRIFGKLEVKRRGQAVAKAKALGLLG